MTVKIKNTSFKNIIITAFVVLVIFLICLFYYKKSVKTSAQITAESGDVAKDETVDTISVVKEKVVEIDNESSDSSEVVPDEREAEVNDKESTEVNKTHSSTSSIINENIESSNDDSSTEQISKNTVLIYYDYNCPHCKKTLHLIKRLTSENQNDVSIELRPLTYVGVDSSELAKASLAVKKIAPDKYFAFHSALMSSDAQGSDKKIQDATKILDIDIVELREAMGDPKIDLILKDNFQTSSEFGITGVPAIVINGKFYSEAVNYDKVLEIIQNNNVVNNDQSSSNIEEEQVTDQQNNSNTTP